jgi:hypothetical protein
MGQRANGLTAPDMADPYRAQSSTAVVRADRDGEQESGRERKEQREEQHEEDPVEIEQEIEDLRTELTALVREIDRRRHDALDIRLQLRRNGPTILVALGAVALVIVGASTLASYRRRRRDSVQMRAANLLRAFTILSREDPDRLLHRSPDARSAALAALAKVAGTAGRRVIQNAM